MNKGLRADSPIVFRPRVVPDRTMMELLEKKREAFSYVPEEGFHRDKIQPRVIPLAPDFSPPWLVAGST